MADHPRLTAKTQEQVCATIVRKARQIKGIQQIIQRGSFANGGADCASDIDLVFVIDDEYLESLIVQLDSWVATCFTLVYPTGWVDTIVPDFGGIGFVYIGHSQGMLVQLDLYITPSSWSKRIREFQEKIVLFDALEKRSASADKRIAKDFITQKIELRNTQVEAIFEFLLLTVVLAKQIFRRRPTLAVKYRYALIEALARLIRLAYTPERESYGMYEWKKDLERFNSPVIKTFESSITEINIFSAEELLHAIQLFKTLLSDSCLISRATEFSPLTLAVENHVRLLLAFPREDGNVTDD